MDEAPRRTPPLRLAPGHQRYEREAQEAIRGFEKKRRLGVGVGPRRIRWCTGRFHDSDARVTLL